LKNAERVKKMAASEIRPLSSTQIREFEGKIAAALIESGTTYKQAKVILKQPRFNDRFSDFLKQLLADNPVWESIQIGTFCSIEDLRREAVIDAGFSIGDIAETVILKMIGVSELADVSLFLHSVGELGLVEGATTKSLYERAMCLGYRLCPKETALHMCRISDVDFKEDVRVATEPLIDSDGDPEILMVEYGIKHIGAYNARPGCFWSPKDLWVFTR